MYVAKRNAMSIRKGQNTAVDSGSPSTKTVSGVPPPPGCVLDSEVNEVYAWHGTNHDVRRIIENIGFNERVASMTGMQGAGIYFAISAGKSDQYCVSCGGDRHYVMFLSRVIMGDVFETDVSHRDMRIPPIKPSTTPGDGTNGDRYDSVLFHRPTFRFPEYVVYNGDQTYPEYVVVYKRVMK
eukprot:PhF_6_TR19951/c2_g1_i5/m.29058